ncbi:MAG TPA: hypothetical protein VGJ52_09975 [Vicinamibacterales bacterium]
MFPPVPAPAPLVAIPLSPPNDAQIGNSAQPGFLVSITLIAKDSGTANGVAVDTFQVARDRDFTVAVQAMTVPRGAEQTSVTTELLANTDYYWRVRAVAGETTSPYSDTFHFRTAAAPFGPPSPVRPAPSSVQSGPLELSVNNVPHDERRGAWIDRFEVATDAAFRSVIFTKDAQEFVTERAAVVPDRPLPRGQTLFWHAQAFDGAGARSEFSETWTFTIGDAVLTAPTLVAPLSGSFVMQRPTLTVLPGTFTFNPNAASPELQIATNPTFAPPYPPQTQGGILQGAAATTLSELAPGTYYWRARMAQFSADFRTKTTSAWTDAWTFTVAPQVIQTPVVISPVFGSTVRAHPTLTVRNAPRSGISSTLLYRFEVATTFDFRSGTVVAAQTVPESPDTTSWTVTPDLPAGVQFYWRVRVNDPVSGAVSPLQGTVGGFAIVRAATSLLTLEITIPSTCSGFLVRNSFAGISDDSIGASHFTFHLTAPDGSAAPSSSVEISVDRGGGIVGTIGGSFGALSISGDGGAPARLTGQLNPGGTMSGTFAGSITAFVNPRLPPNRCSSAAFGWSIGPRG